MRALGHQQIPSLVFRSSQMMSRNLRGFMSLFYANKPVVCKAQDFCVAGGTHMALCGDPAAS